MGLASVAVAFRARPAKADGDIFTAEVEAVKEAVARALQDPDPEVSIAIGLGFREHTSRFYRSSSTAT